MFTNLIESQSHRKDLTRRGRFVLLTLGVYGLLFCSAGIASIYAYDAHLESQMSDLEVLQWVPEVDRKPVEPQRPQPSRRAAASNNTGRVTPQPVRPILYESPSNPTKPPESISTAPNPIPPAPPNSKVGNFIGNPPTPPGGSGGCDNCSGSGNAPSVRVEETTPPPLPVAVKPTTQRVTSQVLSSKVISLPKPAYPAIARPIRLEGPVAIQILVNEQGNVISAQVVSGHPILATPALEAARRARFTPTVLNGTPVKIQGVITYNFQLQ